MTPGQTLARIASRYHVPVAALAAANGLSRQSQLRPGQVLVVPARGVVYVTAGDTLAAIARRHDVSAAELARANRLRDEQALRVGQRLVLPGHESAQAVEAAEAQWGVPRHRGFVVLHRLGTRITRKLRLVDDRGRVRAPALRELSVVLRPRNSRRTKPPHPRLARLLAQVSDHFGGRPLHVVSGYRKAGGNTRDTSRHVAGQALDFRIPSVPLPALREYCAKLDHVGVGYYPHSNFVHLDVRRKNARWTDLAGPGETARLLQAGSPDAESAVADEPQAEDDGQPPVEEPVDLPVPTTTD